MPPPKADDDASEDQAFRLDAFLPYRLSIASNAVSKLIARAYAEAFDLGIPEWRCLAVLQEIGSGTQQDLVGRTLMDKVAVSRAAQALESRGLIDRTEDETDGRARRLSLTPAGRRLFEAIAPTALAYERRLLADFDDAERALLQTLLQRIEAAATRLG